MKMDMVKEFENIIEYLDKKYVDDFGKGQDSTEVWAELKILHLANAQTSLALAKLYDKDEYETNAQKNEAKETINYMYAGFMKFLPDAAFMGDENNSAELLKIN